MKNIKKSLIRKLGLGIMVGASLFGGVGGRGYADVNPWETCIGMNISNDGNQTRAIAVGDVDNDGDLDVVAGNYGLDGYPCPKNKVYLNNGTNDPFYNISGFDITADENRTQDIVLADMDRNGSLDLVTGNYKNEINRLYLNPLIPTPPNVLEVLCSGTSPTEGPNLLFDVIFTENVTGVDISDFSLNKSSGILNGEIGDVIGTGNEYSILVNNVYGEGIIRLDVIDNDSIRDLSGNPLGGIGIGNGGYFTGQEYQIIPQTPRVPLPYLTSAVALLGVGTLSLRRRKRGLESKL